MTARHHLNRKNGRIQSYTVSLFTLIILTATAITAQPKRDSVASKLKPYAEVLKGAVKLPGLFDVHKTDEKVFYEIASRRFDREFLIVAQVSKTQAGYGYGGTELANRVVRWEKRGGSVFLRDVYYGMRSTDGNYTMAVSYSNINAILMSFDILTYGKDSSVVIDATPLFTSDIPEFSPRQQQVQFAQGYDAQALDPKRTYLESVKAFPTNIETRAVLTYRATPIDLSRQPPSPQPPRPRADYALGSITVEVHFSMVELPEKPMKPRAYDSRVGFFTQNFVDYTDANEGIVRKRIISRFRLEKKDPNAAVSEPVKPIIFYIAPEVPAKWRPYIKRGVESWQKAFEKAGFKNAILAKDAPDDNPTWDPEDARYSSIRWLSSEIQNAYGPSIRDPRSGEVLDADIKFFHNISALTQRWYFLQVGAVDERASKMPLPDDLSGELIEYVAAHEVGHCLGFPHNFKASSSYTVKQLRDAQFTAQYGTEASIMDYGRFNYVVQPEDKPRPRLIPIVGPYDEFAVEWGYRDFGALSEDEEKARLNEIALRQIKNPMLRFGRQGDPYDPTAQSEDLGSDPLDASPLGLKNLDRISKKLLTAYARENEDYDKLKDITREYFGQRSLYVGHVASLIGGMIETNYFYGQGDKNFEPVSRERQKAAMSFLQRTVFQLPNTLIPMEVIERIGSVGYADLVLQHQARAIRQVLNTARGNALVDYAIVDKAPYPLVEIVSDLSNGIFSDLWRGSVTQQRRNLQRELVSQLIAKVKAQPIRSPLPNAPVVQESSEMKAVARGQLDALLKRLSGTRGSDDATRAHIADLRLVIREVLGEK